MATMLRRTTTALLLGLLMASAAQVSAQRAGGAAHTGGANRSHTQSTRQTSHQGTRTTTANRNVSTHHNTNVNRNANVNRNVNHNANVKRNVNHNTNVKHERQPQRQREPQRALERQPLGRRADRRLALRMAARLRLRPPLGRLGDAAVVPGCLLLLHRLGNPRTDGPPAHYQWARYGPDLLLVNTLTGQVTDVRYGVFAGSARRSRHRGDGGKGR